MFEIWFGLLSVVRLRSRDKKEQTDELQMKKNCKWGKSYVDLQFVARLHWQLQIKDKRYFYLTLFKPRARSETASQNDTNFSKAFKIFPFLQFQKQMSTYNLNMLNLKRTLESVMTTLTYSLDVVGLNQ